MKKLIALILCFCLCISLSACQEEADSAIDDAYLEGVEQGEVNSFIALWNTHYTGNIQTLGQTWQTNKFTLDIFTKTGSRIDAGVYGSEDDTYLDITFTVSDNTIDEYWKSEKLIFYIYTYRNNGWHKNWGADDYYTYFLLQQDEDTVGSKGIAETTIYDGTEQIAVLLIVDGKTYTALYSIV